jgi:DNA-binding transcriptional LysR family regulator
MDGKAFDPKHNGADHDWIGFASHLQVGAVARWMDEHVPEERIVCRLNTVLGIAETVAAGVGLALLPCFIGSSVPGVARLSPPIRGLETELWLLTHPDLRRTARVRAFIDYCANEIGRQKKLIECPD